MIEKTILFTIALASVPFASVLGENVALDKPASSNRNSWAAPYAVDGDYGTSWNAETYGTPENPMWLKVDLLGVHTIRQVSLYSAAGQFPGYFIGYVLYGSVNDVDWTSVGSGTLVDTFDILDVLPVPGIAMRYVRFDVIGGTHWAHLWELEAYEHPTDRANDIAPGDPPVTMNPKAL